MTEDVERVAMALAHIQREVEQNDMTPQEYWAAINNEVWRMRFRDMARAAISALREPSEAMKARHGEITLICFQEVLDTVLGEPVDA